MALTPYQRRTELARSKGYSSYYYLRQAKTREAIGEKYISDPMERAIQYRTEFGWSISKAAREAHVAPERLSTIEKQFHVAEVRTIVHGNITMLSYVRDRGIVFVELDARNASLNGSYLNYVRWMIYEPGNIGDKVSRRLVEGAPYLDTTKLSKFNNMLRQKGILDQSFHAINVYGTNMENGMLMMNPEPDDSDVDLKWELFSKTLKQYNDEVTEESKTPVYMRR